MHEILLNSFQEYFTKYGKQPDELFINYSTKEKLLQTPHLLNLSHIDVVNNNFPDMRGRKIYVVNMLDDFLWIGNDELSEARQKNKNEDCNRITTPIYVPSTNTNDSVDRNNKWKEISIPRQIIEFEYPKIEH